MTDNKFTPTDIIREFRDKVRKGRSPLILQAAQKSDIRSMNRMLGQCASELRVEEQMRLIDKIIEQPLNFTNMTIVVDSIARSFDFGVYFNARPEAERQIWSMYAHAAHPKVATASAMLAAEHLRCKLLQDDQYVPDFAGMIKAGDEQGLTKSSRTAGMRDSIIATQNALVDYVAHDEAAKYLNRGAGMLAFMSDLVKPEISSLWSRKSTDVQTTTKYTIKDGDIAVTKFTFE